MKLYNTLTGRLEEFEPAEPGHVRMYNCGPTVYGYQHVGNYRTFAFADTLRRWFEARGWRVTQIMNITDVGHLTRDDIEAGEDKIVVKAREMGWDAYKVAEHFMNAFFEDRRVLGFLEPARFPRATEHVGEMIALIERLLEKGYAYRVGGNVYFDVTKFPGYGRLSGNKLETLKAGARIEINPEKRHPADFALWKTDPKHLMQWDSPWGRGFPGWHIECSAMAMKYLGQTLDIHTGGEDNIFPHHECEIAQSEAATGKPFAKYWLHNGMLMIRGEEMHKSLGNFVTLEQAFQQYSPMTIRFFILGSHYRSPLDVTDEALAAAAKGVERLYGTMRRVRAKVEEAPSGPVSETVADLVADAEARFREAMDDDFNTANALAVLFDLNREVNKMVHEDAAVSRESWQQVDALYGRLVGDVLGLITPETYQTQTAGLTDDLLRLLVETRAELRQAKQWALADRIRDRLGALGVVLEDKPSGTTWRIRPPEAGEG